MNKNELIQAIDFLDDYLSSKTEILTPLGVQNPQNGYEIKAFSSTRFSELVCFSVTMLDRSIRENDVIRGGDITDIVISFKRENGKLIFKEPKPERQDF